MSLHRAAADRKTQADASRLTVPRVLYSIKRAEYLCQRCLRDSRPLIQHADDNPAPVIILAAQSDLDRGSFSRVRDGVSNDVLYGASQQLFIPFDPTVLKRDGTSTARAAGPIKVSN